MNPKALKLEEAATGCAQQKGVFKNFAKLTGKHPGLSLFLSIVAGLKPAKIKAPTQVFSCQFYEIFENAFIIENFRVTAFE